MLIHDIGPQSYGQVDGRWYVRTPAARRAVMLNPALHTVTEHEDGTISVTPSLIYGKPGEPYHWHGWLVRGKFIPA